MSLFVMIINSIDYELKSADNPRGVINDKAGKAAALPKFSDTLTYGGL